MPLTITNPRCLRCKTTESVNEDGFCPPCVAWGNENEENLQEIVRIIFDDNFGNSPRMSGLRKALTSRTFIFLVGIQARLTIWSRSVRANLHLLFTKPRMWLIINLIKLTTRLVRAGAASEQRQNTPIT
jgi:hypothetical protein